MTRNFEVVKGEDGKYKTQDKEPEPDVAASRRALREMLNGGGWFEDPNSKKVEEELPAWEKWRCHCSPPMVYPCSYCEHGEYDPDTFGQDEG